MVKKFRPVENMRRGENFVDEPTGSAPQVNLDGRQETRPDSAKEDRNAKAANRQ